MPRIAILIIGFDTADRLLETLDRIPAEIADQVEEVVVYGDGTADESSAGELTTQCGLSREKIAFFRTPHGVRHGRNLKRVLQYVVRRGFDYVVILRSDGRYAPESLNELLAPLETGEADLVIGSRFAPGGRMQTGSMPAYKRVGNRALTFLQNRITGFRHSDFCSGFRAYRTTALAELPLVRNSDSWLFDTQVLLEFDAHRFRVEESSVPAFSSEEISPLNAFFYALACLWESAKFRIAQWHLLRSSPFAAPEPDYRFHDAPGSSHRVILDLLPASPPLRILDVGTASGYLDRELQARGHSVTGIECDPQRAEQARPFCSELIVGDVQTMDLSRYAESFDCVLLADVVEHLVHPEEALQKIVATLKPGGRLIICVPNVANLYVRLNLLFGRFRYEPSGILDATHLRFFTLRTFRDMVEGVGLDIRSIQPTPIPLPWLFSGIRQHGWFRLLYRGLRALTRTFRRAFAYQFVALAEKPEWLAATERTGIVKEATR